MGNTIKHPSQYTDAELLRILQVERTKVTGQLLIAKRQLRQLVSTIKGLEGRLHKITASVDYLNGHNDSGQRQQAGRQEKAPSGTLRAVSGGAVD
jgi:hypothetical protein